MSIEVVEPTYLKALLESVGLLKSGGGLSKTINIPGDLYLVVSFMVQLVIASEVLIEGEVFVDGDLMVV